MKGDNGSEQRDNPVPPVQPQHRHTALRALPCLPGMAHSVREALAQKFPQACRRRMICPAIRRNREVMPAPVHAIEEVRILAAEHFLVETTDLVEHGPPNRTTSSFDHRKAVTIQWRVAERGFGQDWIDVPGNLPSDRVL